MEYVTDNKDKVFEKYPVYGSKDWANWLLKEAIKTLQNKERPAGARLLEVLCFLDDLKEAGYWWQAERLQNHLHRLWADLQPPEAVDPSEEEERGISS